MSKSVGIDLGTTNSSIAIKQVRTEVLRNEDGDLLTPSCVILRQGRLLGGPEFVVGRSALEWRKQDPANTVVAVKRLMGRNFQDPEIQAILAEGRLPYRIARHSRGTENSLGILLQGREFTPEEISAEILKRLRRDAEKACAGSVEFAVITVPAYFNDKQKHATRSAAALAGLKVRRLLSEPTAAAISFGTDQLQGGEARTVLVFDFGGGTLDLSLLTVSAGQFIEQGKGGDMWLGGEDIDRLIADHVLRETAKAGRIQDMARFIEGQEEKRKYRFLGELKAAAEEAKIRLGAESKAGIEILDVLKDAKGAVLDVAVELTREDFDALIAPIVERAVMECRRLLEKTHFTRDMVDQVLAVGGSSQLPALLAALRREFGADKVLLHERPLLAIAEGAAILSHRLSDSYECPGCGAAVAQAQTVCSGCGFDLERHTIEHGVLDIVHAAAHDYHIRLENGVMHLLVEKNTPLPCEKKETFRLVHPEQRLIHLKFFNLVNERHESIGDLWLGVDEDGGSGEESQTPLQVEISLKVDESNLVCVDAVVKEHPEIRLSKTLSRGKADEKLFLSLEQAIDEANREKYPTYVAEDFTCRAVSAIADIHKVVHPETDAVDEATHDLAQLKIEKAQRMAKEGRTSRPMISYAQVALDNFGPFIKPKTREAMLKKIKCLEDMDERGSFEENVQAAKDLNEVLDRLGRVNMLMEIRKAGNYCEEADPAKAPKFLHGLDSIMDAVHGGDMDKAEKLIDELCPEARSVLEPFESAPTLVHKDITK
ncbi:MAG: Hsp70 family protein [Elusimicrobia bacterium]|nr:Hsp70 family protein [Elusimicrobiota bacterium]